MSLDVETPEPPSLSGPQARTNYDAIDMADEVVEDDYRHEELEGFLAEGAWEEAFGEWADRTSLSVEEFRTVESLDMIEAFDFYWDPSAGEVGYLAPTVPEDADLSTGDRSEIEAELDDLGREVTERLENDYLLRDEETFGFFDEEYTAEEERR